MVNPSKWANLKSNFLKFYHRNQVIQHPEVIYTLAQELVAEREQLEGIRKQLDAAQPKADYTFEEGDSL